jgi:hypothetical protein
MRKRALEATRDREAEALRKLHADYQWHVRHGYVERHGLRQVYASAVAWRQMRLANVCRAIDECEE